MSRDWIGEYSQSHQNRVNQFCHGVGIPMIALSPLFALAGVFIPGRWSIRFFASALNFFIVGWIFQFVGHAFEHKPPEFLRDPRFLFVGLRWWFAKLRSRA